MEINKLFLFVVLMLLMAEAPVSSAQDNLHVYLFPGQGSDYRLFDSLNWPSNVDTTIISYGTPEKGMSMKDFAYSLIHRIDTSKQYVLVGVSLGGMICVELSELIEPELTIIISSAKNYKELPFRYNFQKYLPLYQIVPGFLLTTGSQIMQPIIEPDRRKHKETFKSMLKSKKPLYMERTVEMIIEWDRKENFGKIYHIHGDNDHTIPVKNIKKPYYLIEHGSHMMTLTEADRVSKQINKIMERIKN